MRRSGWIGMLVVASQLAACGRMELNVGKKTEESAQPKAEDAGLAMVDYRTWNSLEDSVKHLDELKSMGAEALLQRYRQDGRDKLRLGFRKFRDAVLAEASREDVGPKSPWARLAPGQCVRVDQRDLLGLEEYGDLRGLLETAFLSRIKADKAAAFDPELPPRLDELTKLAFFEFGIAIEGEADYTKDAEADIMRADVKWQVIHEQGEPSAWQKNDASGVLFRFERNLKADGLEMFSLEAAVGEGLFQEHSSTALASMELSYLRKTEESGRNLQAVHYKKGLRLQDGTWKALNVSRRISLIQPTRDSKQLDLIETYRFQMAGETSRRYHIDIAKLELCAQGKPAEHPTPTPVPPKDPGKPGTGGGKPQDPPKGDDPSQNGDDPAQNGDHPSQSGY